MYMHILPENSHELLYQFRIDDFDISLSYLFSCLQSLYIGEPVYFILFLCWVFNFILHSLRPFNKLQHVTRT